MSAKSLLKRAREALVDGNSEYALSLIEDALEADPNNYFGLILKGKCYDALEKPIESAEAYNRAVKQKPHEVTAWKGLLRLYAATNESLKYLDAFEGVVKAFASESDIVGAGVEYNKAVKFIKFKGDLPAKKRFLELQLPGNEVYAFLSPRMPELGLTINRLIALLEKEEKEAINKYISKNKLRVGSSTAKTTDQFKYEIFSNSKLPHLYGELINLTLDDDLRRETEFKLFYYKYEMLLVCPAKEKNVLREEVVDLASGMVIVKAKCALAWAIYLDWQDVASLGDMEYATIEYYVDNFGSEGLAKVLLGFLRSEISPFAIKESLTKQQTGLEDSDVTDRMNENGEVEEEVTQWTPGLVLEMMTDGFETDSGRVLSHRILAGFYLRIQEYETAVDIAHKGIDLAKRIEQSSAVLFPNAKREFSIVLGIAYIYYQAPKNFDIAIQIFDNVLKQDSENVAAKIGKGLILRERGRPQEALGVLRDVVVKHPENFQALFELSWCQILVGELQSGRTGLMECLKLITGTDPQSLDHRSQIWWRIGISHWNEREQNASEATNAFECYVKSLQSNPNYAPAYTSLGFFYSIVMGDSTRATKCFYKAFEIDGGEIEAAEQLAREFARKSEWDLVEIVASRVADSDKIRTHTGSDSSWAFRALGIVALNHRDYAKAVNNFQRALRLAPKDTNSWVGLGEAYSNCGRHVAAEKAFRRCLQIDSSNLIARYQLGLVQRDLHQYSEAIETFKQALKDSPEDLRIPSYLIESYLASARNNIDREFYGEAVTDVIHCLQTSLDSLACGVSTQGVWQAIAGSFEVFLFVQSLLHRLPTKVCVRILEVGYELFPDVETLIEVDEVELHDHLTRKDALVRSVILACHFSLSASGKDSSSRALALSNVGLSYLKAHCWWSSSVEDAEDENLKHSIKYLRRAIQVEPRNLQIWNLYGIASGRINARVAQHCFIRSLSLSYRQPQTWTNLAAMYMTNGDLELASEALDKAQALDPDYVSCWLGQGLIDYIKGNRDRASDVFEHSYTISRGRDMLAKLLHGLVTYEKSVTEERLKKGRFQTLDSAILALHKYHMTCPDDTLAVFLQGSLLERASSHGKGIEDVESLAKLYEDRFEVSEGEEDLISFAKAKALLARLQLAENEYQNAVENASFVLSLLEDDDTRPIIRTSRLSALVTAGIASYFLRYLDQSLQYFERALVVTDTDQAVVILLVQVLWAQGGEHERSAALDYLFSSIGSKGSSVDATVVLGVIGLLGDVSLVEPATEELENLPIGVLEKDHKNHVQEVLSLLQKDIGPWQRAAFLWPTNYEIWKNIEPEIALKIAEAAPQNVNFLELSKAYASADNSLRGAQRSIFFAPWTIHGWRHLSDVLQS